MTSCPPLAGATVERLKAVWECLPEGAWFAGFFESNLTEVTAAQRRRDEYRQRLMDAEDDLQRAEGELAGRIRATMERDWTPEQIAEAMVAACDGEEGA